LAEMLRPDLCGCPCMNVRSLNVENKLLHYVYFHIVSPHNSNYAHLLFDDIFIILAKKYNIIIN